ncbi:hypothetical protein GCM10025760_33190 [Microbacterium yannicii]|uniref:Extracellular solute-binding protein n=1 Tax=Microbacterium yannicii TaxID=671622 RepID=A0ABP9MNY6_9MICO|nr:extracellular solute-binding protein [Microbacterium yannicii]MCO5951790.1 extracellular solute-binding protein [Microbacterium yannicii]
MTSTFLRRGVAVGVLGAAAIAVGLTGCANSGAQESSDDFSLSYPVAENSPYAAMAEKYMKTHKGVTITLNAIPSDSYDNLLRTELQSGNASDVVMATAGSGTPVSLIPLADAGLVSALDGTTADLVGDANRPQFFVDDEMFGQPTDFGVTGTIFDSAAGVTYPTTTDEMLGVCPALNADGVSLYAMAGRVPINAGLTAISLAAGQVYSQDPEWDEKRASGETTFASTSGWQNTLQLILDMQAVGCFQPGAEGAGFEAITGGIGQGASLGAFLPGGVIAQLGPALPDAQLVVEAAPMPTGGAPFIFASSDYALAISAASDRKDAAQAYLNWLAEPEQAQEYAELAGSLPITGIADVDLGGTAYAAVADLLEAGSYTTLPVNVWPPAVFNVLGTDVQALLTGQKDVDQVLADLDAAWTS